MPDSNDSLRQAFGTLATTIDTPEHLGVILGNAILKSAVANRITSEDGQKLVVPIAISLRPLAEEAPARDGINSKCHSECWKVLGHDIFCRRVCVLETETSYDRHAGLADDAALRARVKAGPPLRDADRVESALKAATSRAANASEAGIVIANALAAMLADGTLPFNADGSADIEATAYVSVKEDAKARSGSKTRCTQVCFMVLGYEIVCHESCDELVVVAS